MKTLFNLKDHSSIDLYNLQVLIQTGMEKAEELKVTGLVEDGERWIRLIGEAEQEAQKRETDTIIRDMVKGNHGQI